MKGGSQSRGPPSQIHPEDGDGPAQPPPAHSRGDPRAPAKAWVGCVLGSWWQTAMGWGMPGQELLSRPFCSLGDRARESGRREAGTGDPSARKLSAGTLAVHSPLRVQNLRPMPGGERAFSTGPFFFFLFFIEVILVYNII